MLRNTLHLHLARKASAGPGGQPSWQAPINTLWQEIRDVWNRRGDAALPTM